MTQKDEKLWRVYYRELGGLVTYEDYSELPREVDSPPWYAVRLTDPPEYRLAQNGRWDISSREKIEATINAINQ